MADLTLVPKQTQILYYVENLSEGVTLDMVLIPAGTFQMGSPKDEEGHNLSEEPQHSVTVPSFFMGRYPVTQAQWKQVAGMEPVKRSLDTDRFQSKTANHPVDNVRWDEAVEFCDRLSRYTTHKRYYRLPSESEWEYACRARTQTPFYFGATIRTDLANYNGDYTYGDGPKGEYRGKTTPVDYFRYPNAFGLYDMHGNVREWCQDHWHDNYQGAPLDGSAWEEDPLHNNGRVIRGGSWSDAPGGCRSAFRFDLPRVGRDARIGLRVVVSAPGLSSP